MTSYLIEADWSSGKAKDLDDPQAGGATFRLKNTHRDWEPEYAAGRFYPNILPLRRFRWSVIADGVTYPQGVYYAQAYNVTYPGGTAYSETVVQCVDGFGVLSLLALPALDPPTAESYSDVVLSDEPFAYYRMSETSGRKMAAEAGTDGIYRRFPQLGAANPVLGDKNTAVLFPANSGSFARAPVDDADVFKDAGVATFEAVITDTSPATFRTVTAFGLTAGNYQIRLTNQNATMRSGSATVSTSANVASSGTHHIALTWDGLLLTFYRDGVAVQVAAQGGVLDASSTPEFLYVGAGTTAHDSTDPTVDMTVSHAAFYTDCLTASRIASHATDALSRGYAQSSAGSRVSTLATHPLWSTAGIPSSQITVTPRPQHGQSTLEEILTTVKAETPIGLFYFDDSGNPDYQPWDYPTTVMATLGDLQSETSYSDLALVYDDELFNLSTVIRDGGVSQTKTSSSSVSAYGSRTHDETDLILALDSDASLIAQTIVDRYANPMFRIEAVSLNGAQQSARTHILSREIGDTIRVKRRGEGGTPIDVSTRILGKQKHLDTSRHLTCTWNLARGFSAADAHWRLGQVGYSELGNTTVLG